jgi:hypothetical protein
MGEGEGLRKGDRRERDEKRERGDSEKKYL